jgi:hypothetical protein
LPINGAAARVLAKGRMGGTPHYATEPGEVLINTGDGVEAVSLSDGTRRVITQAVGPGWYFSEGSAASDDLRVSPDGQWGLAQIGQQLHLYRSARRARRLTSPILAARMFSLTDIGADYFGWSEDGEEIYWSLGIGASPCPVGRS